MKTFKPGDRVILDFPAKYDKFSLSDFFQTDVDEFHSGDFILLSIKQVKMKGNEKLSEMVESLADMGWMASTYCYTHSRYLKILVGEYVPKPWKNHYHIEGNIASENGADHFIHGTIEGFKEWATVSNLKINT